jgi:hypothetical protein
LVTGAIRRQQAADSLLTIADPTTSVGIEPMSMEEVDAEVKAVRANRRRRAGGRSLTQTCCRPVVAYLQEEAGSEIGSAAARSVADLRNLS